MGIVSPSLAQRHGQPIIFTTPETEVATNSAPSLEPPATELPDFIKIVQSPLIPTPPSMQPPPAPVVIISPAQAAAAQQQLDREKNWTLLTPAEILGVPTLANTLGVSERNASGEIKNQTALERYFGRQQRSENTAMTNEANALNSSSEWSLQGRDQSQSSPNFSSRQNNSVFGGAQNNDLNANQSAATWPSTFGSQQTPSPVVQTPEQMAAAQAEAQADAENFQKLLQPGLATSAVKATPAMTPVKIASDSFFGTPATVSPGNSFTPVSSGVMVPQGVTPLFGPTSEKNPSTTPVTPEWKRKLPPWMSSGPSSDQKF